MNVNKLLSGACFAGLLLAAGPLIAASETDEEESAPIEVKEDSAEEEKIQESKKSPAKSRNRSKRNYRGPDIVMVEAEEKTIYAYSQNGRLRAIKVVPKIGRPYYLRPADPTKHFGDIERADLLLTTWVLVKF